MTLSATNIIGFLLPLIFLMSILLFIISYIKKAKTHQRNELKRLERLKAQQQKDMEECMRKVAKKQRLAQEKREQAEQLAREKYERFLNDKEFVNKDTKTCDDFIINDHLNACDLEKLARLNGIRLTLPEGWYNITLELVKELGKLGWKARVGRIGNKFPGLLFSAEIPLDQKGDKIIVHHYEELLEAYYGISCHTCEVCGRPAEYDIFETSEEVLCEAHEYP